MAETLQERQQNELEALKAIFNDQLKINNESETSNDVWKPLDVTITVFPEGFENQNSILVDLHVKASENYPNEIPIVKFTNPKGIPANYIMHLEKQINVLCSKIKGEVMIFELAQCTQNFLSHFNKPQYESFYEEMMSRKHRIELDEQETKKQEVELTKQLIHSEMSKKREALKQELRIHRNKSRKNTLESVNDECEDLIEEEQSCLLNTNSPSKQIYFLPKFQDQENVENNGCYTDHLTEYNYSLSQSRLDKEFIILDELGKGAFGDVLKVKNKLDDCFYAIKCIELNKKNKNLNKKITREVKLLSRLNHENVVRYFNSWIEAPKINEETSQKNKKSKTTEIWPLKNITCSWEISNLGDNEFNSESSEDEEDWIAFVPQSDSDKAASYSTEDSSCDQSLPEKTVNQIDQFMYIQMEFCEKSTLRNAVDNGLYNEPERVWRLLREIVEGLSYIHQQGIIHRDLKPVNIFIDSEDHVKIGDFGLATTIVQRHIPDHLETSQVQDIFVDTSQTGNIGTALYVAPELNILGLKTVYNEKVDIYSLGVIFFEMCHKPFGTEMERIQILSDLRMFECILPKEFLKSTNPAQIHIIKWLLNHDPCKRPNSTEILQSQYIPPPKLKDTELQEMVRSTLSNSNSKNYKHLIASCFGQNVTTVEDITFTMTSGKNILYHGRLDKIIDVVKEIFQIHGGVRLNTPLLMPALSSMVNESTVTMMTRWGGLTCVPYNLRIPFARFIAHNPTISNFKRYSIDRAYRQRRVFGLHPRELHEAAFDIITSAQGEITAEAELLSIAGEIFRKLKSFNDNNCIIRLNHMSLVQGILMYSGIERARHLEICSYFAKNKQHNLTQEQIGELEMLGFANHQISIAMNFFSMQHTLSDMIDVCRKITIRKSKCGTFSRQGLLYLETVIKQIESLQVNFSVVIVPGLMNPSQFNSGIIFEIVYENKNKNNTDYEILAAGGCYDRLISSFRSNLDVSNDIKQTSVGISFSLDKLVTLFQIESSDIDVILCSSNNVTALVKLSISKDLWRMGFKTLVLDVEQTLEQIQDYCQEMNVSNIVMLKETNSVLLRRLMGDKFQDKSMSIVEFIESMKKKTRQNSLTSVTQLINNSVKNETRSSSENQYVNIVFVTEEKLTTNVKRRHENQILNAVSKTVQKLSPKVRIEILALNIDPELIKALSLIDFSTFESDIFVLIKRFSHYKKDLNKVYNYCMDPKHKIAETVFIFYTLKGNIFKLMIC